MIGMKKVMVRAWEIAREAATKFGGSAAEYMSEALRQAWAESRMVVIEISSGSRKHKSWIAKITGKHERFGLDRKFMEPANESRMYKDYNLSSGIYEVCNGGDRYFIRVANGQIETIGKYDVLEIVA